MVVHTVYVVNKSGGRIFHQDFTPLPKVSINEYMTRASTFDSMCNIAASLGPVGSRGIEVLEADTFKLFAFQAPTGTRIFVITDPVMFTCDHVLHQIYDLYADYVLKNPFYELEMPIKCSQFEQRLAHYIDSVNGV